MEIFIEISIILLITTAAATFVRFIKQPLIVGYLISGVIVGPYVLNILQSTESVELFSKVGITVLLFIVGLSLNPDTIKTTGKPAIVTGLGQIIFTSFFGFLIIKALGYNNTIAMYGSIALTFSSTIIILKLLSDRGDMENLYGKISIGFLLVQDIVATILLVVVPILGSKNAGTANTSSVIVKLAIAGIGMSIILYVIAKYVLPKFSDYLAKSSELLFIFAISWGLILATVFYKIGFSIEIGALIAGVTLAASKYSYEISSRMRPLRDFFIVMFFVLLGSHLVLTNISILLVPAVILSLFVLVGNPLIVFLLLNLLGYKNKVAFMAGLTVAQISEFSLILMALGLSLGHVDESATTLITLVGIITIIGSTYFIIYADNIYNALHKILDKISIIKKHKNINETGHKEYDMIIFGFGRVGLEFVETAKKENLEYLVVDYNPNVFTGERINNVRYVFGDVEDVEFLEEINTYKSKMVISTIPIFETNALLTRYYKSHNKENGIILLTAKSVQDAQKLYEFGAEFVMLPHYLSARHATEMISKGMNNKDIFKQEKDIQNEQIKKHLN
jgi:Kef-type K+ transport system membrane component KefB